MQNRIVETKRRRDGLRGEGLRTLRCEGMMV